MMDDTPQRETLADVMRTIAPQPMQPVWVDGQLVMEPVPTPLPNGRKWSRERLIEEVRKYAEKADGTFTLLEFSRDLEMSPKTIYFYFDGGWAELLGEIGLEPRPRKVPRRWTKETLIAEYDRVYRLLDRHPTYDEFDRLSPAAHCTLIRRFGRKRDIEAAHEAYRAGLEDKSR